MTTTQTYQGVPLAIRGEGLETLLDVLQLQKARMHDAVVPMQAIESRSGLLVISGMGPDGPAGEPGSFQPSEIMLGDIATKLDVPVKYVRWMHANRPDIFDANLNGLIHGCPAGRQEALARHASIATNPELASNFQVFEPDGRTVKVRTFLTDEGPGLARALLSDRHASFDNLDMLLATLEALAQVADESGFEARIKSCDLSERRMTVRVVVPEMTVHGGKMMEGYKSPFGDAGHGTYGTYGVTAHEEGRQVGDLISAGLVLGNGETGGASWMVAPYAEVLACTNGMTRMKYATRQIHLGGKLEEGVIKWSEETEQANLATVIGKTRDAVRTFLSTEFLQRVFVDELEKLAVKPIENPAELVELVGSKMAYTDEQTAGILDHFIKGGQLTCGGILHAVTSFAQEIENPDTAFDFETSAIEALEVAYANA